MTLKERIILEKQLEEIAAIVSTHIPININYQNICLKEHYIQISNMEFDRYINDLFVTNSKAVENTNYSFFHYKNLEYAKEILNSGCLTFSALSNYKDPMFQDIKEYEHFYESIKLKTLDQFIETQKNNLFITCLTNKPNEAKFWKEYAADGKGVCIELSIHNKRICESFDFREMCYDDSNKFNVIASIQDEVNLKFKKPIFLESHSKFSAYYKKHNEEHDYAWEGERRILINMTNIKDKLPQDFKYEEPKVGVKILRVPFENIFFDATIRSIKLGSGLDENEKIAIKEIINRKYPGLD